MHVLYKYNDKDNVNEKKKKKIALSQFFSPGSLPWALRDLLKMANLS